MPGNNSNRLTPRFGGSCGFRATSCMTFVMIVCLEIVLLSTTSNCAKTFYLHWNSSNSIFRIDNTDHIIDVNKNNAPYEYDQLHIICPSYGANHTVGNETEQYIIYNVSKIEYETCRITNANPRVIAVCNEPMKLMFFTLTFRPFTPSPNGLEFLRGQDYYFISTSSQNDLNRRIGGRCKSDNMKVVFKICCTEDKQKNTSMANGSGGTNAGGGNGGIMLKEYTPLPTVAPNHFPKIYHNRNSNNINMQRVGNDGQLPNSNMTNSLQSSSMSWTDNNVQHSTPGTLGGVQTQLYTPHITSSRPNINSDVNNNSNYSPSHKPTKKTNEYDKHPNDVVKNEELTYNSCAGSLKLLNLNNKTNKLLLNYNVLYNPNIILILIVILTNLFNSQFVSYSWCYQR